RYVIELVLGGTTLHRVFLARVAQLGELGMAEQRVVVDVDLGIECHQGLLARHDERIDLDQAQVLLEIQPVERGGERLELPDLRAGESEPEGELTRLMRAEAGSRMNGGGQDLFGRLMSHRFDVHAASHGGNERNASALTIERDRQIQLARDVRAALDVY